MFSFIQCYSFSGGKNKNKKQSKQPNKKPYVFLKDVSQIISTLHEKMYAATSSEP